MEYIYIDDSNLYIEGRRVSAVQRGMSPTIRDAMSSGILDHEYSISFGKLFEFLTGGQRASVKRLVLFGSTPPPSDSIWTYAKRAGFEIVLHPRNAANREKKIDTGISTMMVRDAYKEADAKCDRFVLVAGDRDYVPPVTALVSDGFPVEVCFWNHAARELTEAASKFTALDPFLNQLAV